MNTEIAIRIFDMIGVEEWKKIKKYMRETGASYKGYANFEKVPTQLLKGPCVHSEKTQKEFLKATIRTYLGAAESEYEEIPRITNDNLIGVVSLMLLRHADVNAIEEIINAVKELPFEDDFSGDAEIETIGNEGKEMKTYLGYMDGYDETFYNFYPLYEYRNYEFVKIENIEEVFPNYGNFAVYSKDRYYDKETDIKKREFCVISLEDDDIFQNINSNTGLLNGSNYKIFIDDIAKAKKLFKLDDFNVYPIVTPVDQNIDFTQNTIIDVNEDFPIFKYMTKSVLYYQGEYYGPFETGFRSYNRKVYVNTKIAEKNYLIDKYTIVDNSNDPVLYCEYYKSERGKDFLVIDDSIEKETIDFASDDILLSAFSNSLKSFSDEKNITIEDLPALLNDFKDSPFAQIPEQPEISRKRLERFTTIFSNFNNIKEMTTTAFELIQNIFMGLDEEKKNDIVETIINNPNFLNGIQGHKIVVSKIQEKEKQLEDLQTKCDELQENIKLQEETYREDFLNNLDEKRLELENLKLEVSDNQNKLNVITEKLGVAQDTEELSILHSHYAAKYQTLERKINDKIEEAKNAVTELSFDDQFDKMISLKMSEAFSKYQKGIDDNIYEEVAKKVSNISTEIEDVGKLINRIVTEVQKYRPTYDKNTVLNIMICMTQGFLTILSGAPGTGKTSICEIVAHVLGLDKPISNDNDVLTKRFTFVPVERGWNSKRDLIGYYNPLSKRIEKSNSDLYDALKVLNVENEGSKYPMVVLLDEANLSPMEYYWADFVKICDDIDSSKPKFVDLGDGRKLLIPTTLRFLATINNDHTVEKISPRLIDRAFVISLPATYSNKAKKDFDDSFEVVNWESLKNAFSSCDVAMEPHANAIYEQIKGIFQEMKQPISPRVENNINSYCSVAQNIFESENGRDASVIALDYAVSQKLITKISGSEDEYRKKLDKLIELCKKENLYLTATQLDRIITNGNDMNYYEYFC